jgi:hypothetical protein
VVFPLPDAGAPTTSARAVTAAPRGPGAG